MTRRLLVAIAIASALSACGKAPVDTNQTNNVQQQEQNQSVQSET